MSMIKTKIEDVVIIEPHLIKTQNGYFLEIFSEKEFKDKVNNIDFCQGNESMSRFSVMRGFHFQRPPFVPSKLLRCVEEKVLDVTVENRKSSPIYGEHVAVELSAENHRQLFIPQGFAHGFSVLSEKAIIQYKCDKFCHHKVEDGISVWDESLGIDWKIPVVQAVLSDKDTKYRLLRDFDSPFE